MEEFETIEVLLMGKKSIGKFSILDKKNIEHRECQGASSC